MPAEFTNESISIAALPKYETVNYHAISPKQRWKALTVLFIFFIPLLIAFFIFKSFVLTNSVATLASILLLAIFLFKSIDIILKQKYYGYALREKDVLFRSGYLITSTVIIPINRVQHLSINQSAFDKLFGIAGLRVFTAGGSSSDIAIPGLSPNIANNLKDTISKRANSYGEERI